MDMSAPQPTLDQAAPVEVRFGGFWIRVGATILDIIVLIPLIIAGFFVPGPALFILVNLVALAYKPVMEKQFGATVGKMLLGLRVLDKGLQPINWATAWTRSVFVILMTVPGWIYNLKMREAGISMWDPAAMEQFNQENATLQMINLGTNLLWLVAVIWVAFHPFKKGLHDLLADTCVVYKETLPLSD